MLVQRLAWGGGTIVTAVLGYLAFVAVENELAKWSFGIIFALLFIASMIMFPWGQNDDGSARRLINLVVRGHNNPTIVSGDDSQVRGNVVTTGKRNTVRITHGAPLGVLEVRQISLDASRAEVLPAARAVASETAIAEVDRRSDVMTNKVIERINETNPGLFVRWDDPRFLAVLTSAQRSYAETGDENLADVLAGLVVGLAAQPIRSRREIILRQAIDVAPRLTPEHINALSVNMYLTGLKLNEPYDTDGLIRAFDTLLSPYYGRLPNSHLDYQYMTSTGVCFTDQVGAFAGGPFEMIYNRYPNSMYRAFTLDELRQNFFMTEDNPSLKEEQELLVAIPESPDDVIQTEQGTAINIERVRFRVAPDRVATVLSSNRDAENQLTTTEKQLRHIIRRRSTSVGEFEERVAELKPELSEFLTYVQRTDALSFRLHPVGFMLAQHEIKSRAPQLAALIDSTFDDEA